MSTDIASMDSAAVAVLGGANEALARLGEWVRAARDAEELVAQLVDTPFVPDAYRPRIDPRATPAQQAAARQIAVATGTAAVLQGITLGLDPLTSLQQIYIVHGRPGMYAKLMVALVQAHGHEVWTEDLSDSRAVVCGRRKGTDYVERVAVSMDQARKAGWTSNQAYAKTPQDMLWSRAAGRVCDRIASDVLKGIASLEEIQDSIQTTAEVGNGHRTVSPRRKAPASAIEASEEPPLESETPAEPAEEPAAESTQPERPAGSITGAQQRMLHALLRDYGLGDNREAALVYIGEAISRDVESTKELSKSEAGKVIDALNAAMTGVEMEPTLEVE